MRVRLSELAATSGASIPTIKFYLREGLLPPGRTVSARQAEYDESHVERLRLVRALIDVGGLSVAAVKEVLAATQVGVDEAVGTAHAALPPGVPGPGPFARASRVVRDLGWAVDESSAAMGRLEQALAAVESVGLPLDDELLGAYASAALAVARYDVGSAAQDRAQGAVDAVTYVVLGTVLYEPVLLALRRLAQSHVYGERFSRGPGTAS
ncbi:regulatory protein MerR [Cellulomonas fimi ATCC 484]|uniref:Regulatory protein MerR n=1 Tax=Cellulomonas fimi (strain ATCC 484 / DSM 20113 / JCM 1341 / CCUG 24087 / LMG 16345 / NBRC 15513 / NCIMB 8980 / NCTC 7547 / NRS-133) TaxID=590998 RepID=F4H5K2_CELFA|nr:regulatory protein MerR [Cellulomonas fimi ATCC 484]VEH26130.1 Cd(II)/Pb(II)-responsive transcriptional regulator [Cellulomonas fimi]